MAHPGRLSTFATEPWVPTQWLSQVALAAVEDLGGLPAVAWLFGAGDLALVVTVYLVCRRESDVLPAALVTVLALIGAAGAVGERPQLVSLVLIAVTVSAWVATGRDLRARWWLVPLTWVWAMLHGMWVIAPVVGAVSVVGMWLDRRVRGRAWAKLAAVPVLSAAAAALTPVGPSLYVAVATVGERSSFLTEWHPATFRSLSPILTAVAVLVVLVIEVRRRPVSWARIGLVLLALAWTAYTVRTVAVGAILVAPLLAGALQTLLPEHHRGPSRRVEASVVGGAVLACLIALGLAVPHTSERPAAVPRAMNDRFDALAPGTTVLDLDRLGGWLEWRHPQLNPVLDGYLDTYPVSHIRDYVATLGLEPGWEGRVEASGAEVALLGEESPLAYALEQQMDWRAAASDEEFVLLVAPE